MTQSPNSLKNSPGQTPGPQPVVPVRAPILPKRIVLLIADPEWWAKSAMYRYSVTFWALFWVLVLSSVILAMSLVYPAAQKFAISAHDFAASYDQNYPPMILENGTLSFQGPRAKPKEYIQVVANNAELVVNPSGQTNIPPPIGPLAMDVSVNKTDMIMQSIFGPQDESLVDVQKYLLRLLNQTDYSSVSIDKVPPVVLNSASLTRIVDSLAPFFVLSSVFAVVVILLLLQAIWCLLMILLTGPLVVMMSRNLGMPLRVAYRVSTAVMVPAVAVNCLLESLGIVSLNNQTADQWVIFVQWVLWLSPIPIAFWAGMIANRIFTTSKMPKQK
jgi:Protein of unknown function (DUF1189)